VGDAAFIMHEAENTPLHPKALGRALPFFIIAIAFTWTLQLPAAIAAHLEHTEAAAKLMPLAALGVFGPTVAALLLARSREGIPALLRPLTRARVGIGWYAVALLLPGSALVASLAIWAAATGDMARPFVYPPVDPERVAALLLIPLAEEIGWRGFAYPRLERVHGPLWASTIVGVWWAAWHLPMFAIAGVPLAVLPLMLVFFVCGSVFFTWVFRRTGGSLLLVVIAHAGGHLNNSHLALPNDMVPAIAHTVGYLVLAVTLVLFDRGAFGRR
jgi:uncharacterized protein